MWNQRLRYWWLRHTRIQPWTCTETSKNLWKSKSKQITQEKKFLLGFKKKLMQSDMDLNPSECPTTWISQKRVRNFRNWFSPKYLDELRGLVHRDLDSEMLRLNRIERFTVTIWGFSRDCWFWRLPWSFGWEICSSVYQSFQLWASNF